MGHCIMQFKEFDWLSGHGIWAIIPCPTSVRVILGRFCFYFSLLFGGVFNKIIILLALVGYEMIIANSAVRASLAIYHLISNARSWNNCQLWHTVTQLLVYFIQEENWRSQVLSTNQELKMTLDSNNNNNTNHKSCNFLDCDWFKKLVFSTDSLAKLLSAKLLSDSSISQSHSKV